MENMEMANEFYRLLQEIKIWLRMTKLGTEKWPGGPDDINEQRLVTVLKELHSNISDVTEIATCIKNKLPLKEDETFCCFLCVAKKPEYVSDVTGPRQPPPPRPMMAPDSPSDDFPFAELKGSAWRALSYYKILEPDIMEAVRQKREEDKIKYSSK